VNGVVYHRLRNSNGTWTPWASTGTPNTATAIAISIV
jgi:hypothetical protein